MAKPILLDRFRSDSTNAKLDLLIDEVRDMKQDIRDINARIDKLDDKIDGVEESLNDKIDKLDEKFDKKIEDTRKELKAEIDKNRTELMQEIGTARWQVIGVIVGQVLAVGAIVWAIVSALK